MSALVISGDTSGQISVTVPAVAGSNTITLPAGTGTAAVQGVSTNIVSGTAVASTSGTSIDFSTVPSWAKRITVMFNAVSTTGTADLIVQMGDAGGIETSGYVGAIQTNGAGGTAFSAGFVVFTYGTAAQAANGQLILSLLDSASATWVGSVACNDGGGSRNIIGSGAKALSPGPLTTIRITTATGTPTFDAGSVNILWE